MLFVLVLPLVSGGCAGSVAARMHRADRLLERGAVTEAVKRYDEVAADPAATPAQRVRVYTSAGLACEQAGDLVCARIRLERAAEAGVPGESEEACFRLGELLRTEDRARALNYYYRAAAGADRYRRRGFPYERAMARIVELTRQ